MSLYLSHSPALSDFFLLQYLTPSHSSSDMSYSFLKLPQSHILLLCFTYSSCSLALFYNICHSCLTLLTLYNLFRTPKWRITHSAWLQFVFLWIFTHFTLSLQCLYTVSLSFSAVVCHICHITLMIHTVCLFLSTCLNIHFNVFVSIFTSHSLALSESFFSLQCLYTRLAL